tara:strand:- start:983 stop:1360 length:378 start_codon:yes stop_codon:yes gene_type:complete
MSLIDSTFKALPEQLLNTFGINVTYIKAFETKTYNPSNGEVDGIDSTLSLKAIISNLSGSVYEGNSQSTDLKIIFGNKELGTYYPKVHDRIQYTEDSKDKVARIISINTSRGDNPILHTVIARPQ